MRILFITSANLTTNPRLAKEMELAEELGWEVEFVGFDLGGWSTGIENEEAAKYRAKKVYLPARRRPVFKWLADVICERLSRLIYPLLPGSLKITAYAHSRRSRRLWKYLRGLRNKKYDLIVAHNLAALYPAWRIARRLNVPFGFDVEDYHPGEAITSDADNERHRREQLMQRILPEAAYITVAAPLIGELVRKLIGRYPHDRIVLINNVFPDEEFIYIPPGHGKLRFVWFSQNIAPGRGLELILPALEQFKDKLELTLIGNLYPEFYESVLVHYQDFVNIRKPMPRKELNYILGEFDIGLAIEISFADINKRICLSNKIWAYFQAGLYILATDTPAQQLFIQQFANHGRIIPQSTQDIVPVIKQVIDQADNIRRNKQVRFKAARKHGWSKEKIKLKQLWERTLKTS